MKQLLPLLLLFGSTAQAQIPTFADDIAAIMYEKCASCHHTGSIAPFPLISYQDVSGMALDIQHSVNDGHMPPWPPDSDYQSYAHDRSLSDLEIQKINDWVLAGMPSGDLNNAPAPPSFNSGTFLSGSPDLELRIPTYASKATSTQDDYVCFSIPTGLTNDRYLKAIEVVPGNREIVHHVLVFKDDFGNYQTDTSGTCTGPIAGMLTGYAPGEMPMVFPNGGTVKMGVKIKAGSNIVLAMHYPNGSAGMLDSTAVHLYFYDEGTPGVREVTTLPVLQKSNFCIAPETIDTLTASFPGAIGVNTNFSLLSVFPHAHLLGKEMLVYALTAANDTIPLIHIPAWDFHWQGFYVFKNIIKLPTGSRIFGHISYDNTSDNPHNPNTPPAQVCEGLNTTDEMFLVYFQYLVYQTGDENIDLEALTSFPPVGYAPPDAQSFDWQAYPNPFREAVNFDYSLNTDADVRLSIYNSIGQRVATLENARQSAGDYRYQWTGGDLAPGWYMAQLQVGEAIYTKKIVWRGR